MHEVFLSIAVAAGVLVLGIFCYSLFKVSPSSEQPLDWDGKDIIK